MPVVKRFWKNDQQPSMPRPQVLPLRLQTLGRCEMSNGWVLFAYVVVYGFIIAYTAFLVMRWRSVRDKVEN